MFLNKIILIFFFPLKQFRCANCSPFIWKLFSLFWANSLYEYLQHLGWQQIICKLFTINASMFYFYKWFFITFLLAVGVITDMICILLARKSSFFFAVSNMFLDFFFCNRTKTVNSYRKKDTKFNKKNYFFFLFVCVISSVWL